MTDDLFADLGEMARRFRPEAADAAQILDSLDSLEQSVQGQVVENEAFGRIGQFGQFSKADENFRTRDRSSDIEFPPDPLLETGERARALNEVSKLSNSSNASENNGMELDSFGQSPAELSKVSNLRDRREAFEERAAILEFDEGLTRADAERVSAEQTGYDPRPRPSGVTIIAMPIEVPGTEYDAHMDALIMASPQGSAERTVLMTKKRQGRVVPRGDGFIFTRGRP